MELYGSVSSRPCALHVTGLGALRNRTHCITVVGERSAMAVQAAQDAGLASACHVQGGMDAWKRAGGPVVR